MVKLQRKNTPSCNSQIEKRLRLWSQVFWGEAVRAIAYGSRSQRREGQLKLNLRGFPVKGFHRQDGVSRHSKCSQASASFDTSFLSKVKEFTPQHLDLSLVCLCCGFKIKYQNCCGILANDPELSRLPFALSMHLFCDVLLFV